MSFKVYYRVVDCEFNRQWYKDMIGQVYDYAPGYVLVQRLPGNFEPQDDVNREPIEIEQPKLFGPEDEL